MSRKRVRRDENETPDEILPTIDPDILYSCLKLKSLNPTGIEDPMKIL